MRYVLLWLTLALSAPIQAAEVVEYALAAKQLVSLNDEARDSGLRPRMSNPEAAKALSIAGDSQRFLFSGPVSPNELAIFCQVSTGLVQLYLSDVYKPTSAAEKTRYRHEDLVAITAEYVDELILIKPFLSHCNGLMMKQLADVKPQAHQSISEQHLDSVLVIQALVLSDFIGTLAIADETTLPLNYRLTLLRTIEQHTSSISRTLAERERSRIAGLVDEVLEAAESPISNELQKVKDALLSVEGCEAVCVMLDRP